MKSIGDKPLPIPSWSGYNNGIFSTLLLILGNLLSSSEAWIPPPPDKIHEFESVHEMRRRLNVTFEYSPTLIHDEACRHMTESECRDADVSMQQYAQDQRNLQGWRISASPEIGDFKVS